MPVRRYLWLTLAAGHLIVVLCGACYSLPDWNCVRVTPVLQWYATMSGADSTFGFFAPEVGSLHRATFSLDDGQGATWCDGFDQTSSSEARLRLTGIVDSAFMSGEAEESPGWRKHLVRSWAGTMFTRHPTAESLTVVVEAYDVPTMSAAREGARPGWREVYRANVQRHAPKVRPRSDQ